MNFHPKITQALNFDNRFSNDFLWNLLNESKRDRYCRNLLLRSFNRTEEQKMELDARTIFRERMTKYLKSIGSPALGSKKLLNFFPVNFEKERKECASASACASLCPAKDSLAKSCTLVGPSASSQHENGSSKSGSEDDYETWNFMKRWDAAAIKKRLNTDGDECIELTDSPVRKKFQKGQFTNPENGSLEFEATNGADDEVYLYYEANDTDTTVSLSSESQVAASTKEVSSVLRTRDTSTQTCNEDNMDESFAICEGANVGKDISTGYEESILFDVKLKISDQELPAHKFILACRSPVFRKMFEDDFKEKQDNTVDLIEMEVSTAEELLRFIYTGKVFETNVDAVIKLYVAADRYDIPTLQDMCRRLIINQISVQNVGWIADLADFHSDKLLDKATKKFLKLNTAKVVKTSEWKNLKDKKPLFCVDLLETVFEMADVE